MSARWLADSAGLYVAPGLKGALNTMAAPRIRLKRKWTFVAGGALAMAFATALVLNLSTGEHKVTEPLPGRYAVHDPQFQRTMGALFSSPLEDGNLAEDFQNGDENHKYDQLLGTGQERLWHDEFC